jgi:subtilase family serine protease
MDLRAAAEGVGMYFASGDTPGASWVTDADPYATAVGGTTLGIGARNNRVFETGWSDDYASLDTYTQQVTAKGYDTMTGVGAPNGAAFITGLRRAADCSHPVPDKRETRQGHPPT